MRWQGFLVGLLTLTFLDVVVRSPANAQRAGGIISGIAKVTDKIIDPAVPAFGPVAGSSSPPTYGGGPESAPSPKTGQTLTPSQQQQVQGRLGIPQSSNTSGGLPPGIIAV